MAFFKKLPDLLYVSKITKSGFGDYTKVKNLFRMYKMSDNAKRHAIQFYKYTIPEGSKPEDVALEIYDSPNLHWVILMINEVTDIYEQWPMDYEILYKYTTELYGNADATHHYETLERKDADGNIVIPAGLQVETGWTQEYIHSTNPLVKKTLTLASDTTPVTNFEYEEQKNTKKREIDLIKPEFLQFFIQDFEAITSYDQNSDLEDRRTKKTEVDLVRKYY